MRLCQSFSIGCGLISFPHLSKQSRQGVTLGMVRTLQECPFSEATDRSVAADYLVVGDAGEDEDEEEEDDKEEDEEEEDEEEDEDEGYSE